MTVGFLYGAGAETLRGQHGEDAVHLDGVQQWLAETKGSHTCLQVGEAAASLCVPFRLFYDGGVLIRSWR